MSDLWLDSGVLATVRDVIGDRECHLVGGAVRDHLLGRPAHDLDLVIAGDDDLIDLLATRLSARRIEIGGHRFAATRPPVTSG